MRAVVMAAIIGLLGYGGMLGAESVEFRPARVVDAVADTSDLAIGTAAYQVPLDEPTPATASLSSPTPAVPSTRVPTTTGAPTPPPVVSSAPTTLETTTTSTIAIPTTPPPPTVRERGEQALESFAYDWQNGLPGWEISFHPGRTGVLGYTFVQEKRIEVYVRADMSDPLLAHVIAHEMGHAIDVSQNTGEDRRRWQQERGISDKPWWPGNGATDFSTGAGDFAESFAAWQVGSGSFRSKLGAPPDAAARALLEELVNS